MLGEPLLLGLKIVPVELAAHEVQTGIPGGNPAGPAPQVGIQNPVSGLGIPGKKDQAYSATGFWVGWDPHLLAGHVALQHPLPAETKQADGP